jgi:hypothetical protein
MTAESFTCVHQIWTDVWHPHRCGKPAKFYYDGLGGPVALCGIHARSARHGAKNVKPIAALSASRDPS